MTQSDTQIIIDDFEIRQRVESLAGKNARVVDCEKKSSFVTEETLFINGIPVKLVGKAGERIKEALKSGQPPPVELLSEILIQAGIQKNPVQLETTMTVKSSTKTSELSTLRDRKGKLVDEKLKEFEEDDEIQTASVEIWEKDDEVEKLRMMTYFDEFRANLVDPFIAIPKPLPRTHTLDRTSPKTPQSRHSPSPPNNSTYGNNKNNSPSQFPSNNYENGYVCNSMKKFPPSPTSPTAQYYYPKQQQRPSDPPPRIPSLMTPLKLNLRSNKPVPPPKPNKTKFHDIPNAINSTFSSSTTESLLRREKNFELPVRVVYETFI